MVEYIYYDGIGAKKSGKHSVKEFLKIMNKHFNIQCSEFLHDFDYKPCSEYKEMNIKARDNNKPRFTFPHQQTIFYKSLLNKCNQYKKTAKKRICNLDEYMKFSGAEKKM